MSGEPDEIDLAEIADCDTRVISIIWSDDSDFPEVDAESCTSVYEAIGILRAALRKLTHESDIPTEED